MAEPYAIQYANEAVADIRPQRTFDQRKIVEGIELYLTHQPKQVSKSRIKAMVQPFWSQYRLRLDGYRVYYDVDDSTRQVNVLRVLAKTTDPTSEKAP